MAKRKFDATANVLAGTPPSIFRDHSPFVPARASGRAPEPVQLRPHGQSSSEIACLLATFSESGKFFVAVVRRRGVHDVLDKQNNSDYMGGKTQSAVLHLRAVAPVIATVRVQRMWVWHRRDARRAQVEIVTDVAVVADVAADVVVTAVAHVGKSWVLRVVQVPEHHHR